MWLYLLYLTTAAILTIMVLVIHEMGHWAVLRYYQIPVASWGIGFGPRLFTWGRIRLHLFPIGAYVEPGAGYPEAPPVFRIWIALGGPLANLLYGGLLAALAPLAANGDPHHALALLANFNLALAAFNLLPVPPLDGWAALVAFVERLGHPLHSRTKVMASRVGNGFVWAIATWAIGETAWPWLLGHG
ncbi:site-2 protease family protein [Thiomonas sp.]